MMNNLILNFKSKRRSKNVRKTLLIISVTLLIVFILFPLEIKQFFSSTTNRFFGTGVVLDDAIAQKDIITKSKFSLLQENIALRKENEILKQEEAFNATSPEGNVITEALVVGRPPYTSNNIIILNKGSEDGIEVGNLVFESSFIVGKVSRVTKSTAEVLTFISKFSEQQISVGGYIGSGKGRNTDILILVPETENIMERDEAQAVIDEERYPIGIVSHIEKKDGELVNNVYIQPIINLSKLNTLRVISN